LESVLVLEGHWVKLVSHALRGCALWTFNLVLR
jgi:hypothetical protein